jgi:hypothetical protein
MSLSSAKTRLLRHLSNIPGWRTPRKILVIESDDWGSVRMPSLAVFHHLQNAGINVNGSGAASYNSLDTLASPEDLSALFDTLSLFSDKHGKPCVMTAVCVVANPDFQNIKAHHFTKYFFEPFTRTLNRYYSNNDSFMLWLEGLKRGVFVPQFHGREHLNVAEWMRALQSGDKDTHQAFEKGLWGFARKNGHKAFIPFQAAFDFYESGDLKFQSEAIVEGLSLFYELFGYQATFFVPPNGPFSRSLEKVAADNGIRYLSTPKIHSEPLGLGKSKRVFHWLGQRNLHQQYYMVRNCFFEPWQGQRDWVDSCLKDIETAFAWHKPAVVSSHRVNYIGVHNVANRDQNLAQLQKLLIGVKGRWPEVEFMASHQLGSVIAGTYGD